MKLFLCAMRRPLALLLTLLLLASALAACKNEPLETSEGATPGLAYELNAEKTAYIVTGMGTATDTNIVIPEMYQGLPVEEIGDAAFRTCTELVDVDLPKTVKRIGSRAFWDCVSLKTFTVKEGSELTEIGYGAFSGCAGLLQFNLYEDSKITAIGKSAFAGCAKITGILLPKGITAIEPYTFKNCTELLRITVPASVTSIGEYAFEKCVKLTKLSFASDSKLVSVGMSAFDYCEGLQEVKLPDTVERIGASAFRHCTSLRAFTLPAATAEIGSYAFSLTDLVSLDVAQGNTKYMATGNCVIEKATKTLVLGCRKSEIPAGGAVKAIGLAAFAECKGLNSLRIPEGVEKICSYAFYNCGSLMSLDFAASIKTVEAGAFLLSDELRQVFYHGSDADRAAIPVEEGNETLYGDAYTSLYRVRWYYYSATKPETSNTHWRYVNDLPKAWVFRT
ncbi:MAG: leucine-rich repeat domain-containing protein [Clostridia bacterium]|nr:leucine-rich repeat domain-containing protein [Clostridia bacterium]